MDPTVALWSARTWRSPRTLRAPTDIKIHQRNTVPQEIPGFTQNTGDHSEPPRSVECSRNTVVSRDHRSIRDMGGGSPGYGSPPQTLGFTKFTKPTRDSRVHWWNKLF